MFKSTTTFASFSVDDLEKAKQFYATTLGIPVEEHMPGMMTLKTRGAGDVNIFVKKHHVPATFTVLNFVVNDIAKTMEELSRHAITFEHYDGEEDISLMKKVLRRLKESKPPGSKIQQAIFCNCSRCQQVSHRTVPMSCRGARDRNANE